jgi:acyl-CoA thioesterase FadM
MFARNYKVRGEDVNDFMVMQNFAYLSYASRLIEAYLMEKGFPQLKLNSLKIGWQKSNDQLKNKKHLMFTQNFSARLNFGTNHQEDGIQTYIDFYNDKSELVATIFTELYWIDYNNWECIPLPQKLQHLFVTHSNYKYAV